MKNFSAKNTVGHNDYISSVTPDDNVTRIQMTLLLPAFLGINACWSQQKGIALYLELFFFDKENKVQNKISFIQLIAQKEKEGRKGRSPFNSWSERVKPSHEYLPFSYATDATGVVHICRPLATLIFMFSLFWSRDAFFKDRHSNAKGVFEVFFLLALSVY